MTNEPTNHHPHLNPGELVAALGQIRDAAWWAEVSCLRFMVFTDTCSSEACSATWDEIDWETNTWHIPAARMKGGRPHAVPLSSLAIGILTYAKARTNGDGPIFPAERGGKCLAEARLAALMRRLEIPGTPHGIRRSFKNWAAAGQRRRQDPPQCIAGPVPGVRHAGLLTPNVVRQTAVA